MKNSKVSDLIVSHEPLSLNQTVLPVVVIHKGGLQAGSYEPLHKIPISSIVDLIVSETKKHDIEMVNIEGGFVFRKIKG